jgi:acyl carrier protein
MNHIEKTVVNLAEQFTKKKDINFSLESEFKKDLGFDSLSLVEFIIACEDEFGIEIDLDDPDAISVKNLGGLSTAIEQLLP